ncbi:MAG: phosphatidate cytidylyltransferase [Chloroflexota bacterium]
MARPKLLNTATRVFRGSDFRRRLTTALFGIPFMLAIVYFGTPLWDTFVIVVALLCVRELWHMIIPKSLVGLTGMILITLACFLCFRINNYLILAAVFLAFLIVQAARSLFTSGSKRQFLLRNFVYATLGALYIGIPLTLIIAVRGMDRGVEWTALAFANNWTTDGLALIGGRMFGRHKLAPTISPSKTIEGALIGLVCGFSFGLILALWVGFPVQLALIANFAISTLTVVGDLLESLIKRSFSVKDAGDILPGHGGLLDRVDGMLLAGPALYLILLLH